MSSNLAKSLDCSRGGSGVEVRPTGVGDCEVRRKEQVSEDPPRPFSGTGSPRLLVVFPVAGRGALPRIRALWAGSGEKTLVGFPPSASPERGGGCLEVDVQAGPLGSP